MARRRRGRRGRRRSYKVKRRSVGRQKGGYRM